MSDLPGLAVMVLGVVLFGWLVQGIRIAGRHASGTAPQQVPFIGGAEPQTHAWQRYHVRYYPMVLLLIAFEMEMMFMYPWAVVYVAEGIKAMVEMGMFLGILALGILYAWREGVFRWQ